MSVPAMHLHNEINLRTLLQDLADAPAKSITGVATDSRMLQPGNVFLACAGINGHGMDFVNQATAAGVVAIVYDSNTAEPPDIESKTLFVAVPDLHLHLGLIANRWYDSPSEALTVIAVTGTNGKTTVSMMLAQCLQYLGRRCGYVGTLGKGIDELDGSDGLTSPACLQMHQALAEFRDDQASYAAVEVSSHALVQSRTDGVQFDAAIFTNLSRDHLDYHGNMQSYFESKARLFSIAGLEHRIINIDSEFGQELAARCENNVVLVSTNFARVANGRPFVFVRAVVADKSGSRVSFDSSWGSAEFRIDLLGEFNVENAVLVLATLLRYDISLAAACAALGEVSAPPGRMQHVYPENGATLPAVYVDYAHTPSGLEAALRACRQHCAGELWCVFGCGGDRDSGKRPQMGKVVTRLADRPIVTNDNPRTEDPSKIASDIVSGMSPGALVIEDRAAAIAYAISAASDSDTILIAGKGHESMQLIGSRSIPFSDFVVAKTNLEARSTRTTES